MRKNVNSQGIPWAEILSKREQIALLDVQRKEEETGRPDRKGVRTYLPRGIRRRRDDEPSLN